MVEARDKKEMLAAQAQAFLDSLKAAHENTRGELSRLTSVFDGMASSYDLAGRRALAAEKSVETFRKDLSEIERRLGEYERRLGAVEVLIRGARHERQGG
jgi:chromosome segregation ATPase